jgi:hypothetical protein
MPMPAETTMNNRTGKYSASTHTSAPESASAVDPAQDRRDDGK